MQEKPPISNKMFVLVNREDFKLLVSSKKAPSVTLKRIDAAEKFPRLACSYVAERTAQDCVLCEICGYLFANDFIFRKHFVHQSFHHLQSFKCERCGRLFQTEHLLKQHHVNLKIRAGWRCKPYQCDVCSSRFSRMKFLKNHLSLNKKCVLKCTICGRYFLENNMLKSHIIDNHIIPKIKREDNYPVVRDFGVLQGDTGTCSSHQTTSPHSNIFTIKIEPLDTERTKNNVSCQTDSTTSPTMPTPEPLGQNPFESVDLEHAVHFMAHGRMCVPRDACPAMQNMSQITTGTNCYVPIQYHHAAIPQLIVEKHSFLIKNTHNAWSNTSSMAMRNDFVHSQPQQAVFLQPSAHEDSLPTKDTSQLQDTLTVSADSQVIQNKSQQAVFPDSCAGMEQSLVQNSHRLLSNLLSKPPVITTLSPPTQNQSQQFVFQQANTGIGSLPLKRTPWSVTSKESDQVMHLFVQIAKDQTDGQMYEDKQSVLPPGFIDQPFHTAFESFSTGTDDQVYSLAKKTSQNNVPKESQEQSEHNTSLLVTKMQSGSRVDIQNKICNITSCLVCKKKFISNLGSDQHIVYIFQCTKCKRMFSQEEEVLTHKCDKFDMPISSYSTKNKKTMQPNELAVASRATGNSEELLKTVPIDAQQSVHEARKSCLVLKDTSSTGTNVSDQCCLSCRSIIVNVHKPQTQPTVHLVNDSSQLQMIQNLTGNTVSLLFKSRSSFDQYTSNSSADDLRSPLERTIDSSHGKDTIQQIPDCLQQKTLDSSHEKDSIKNVLACLRQKVIEKIRNNISCLIDHSYKNNDSVWIEQSFPAGSTKNSNQVRIKQDDMSVWNDTPMEITSNRNETSSVGMTCNMTETSGNLGEDDYQENKNACKSQIKKEVTDSAEAHKLRGGHSWTFTSGQVSEMGEGLLCQMEETAKKPNWTDPKELIKGYGEKLVITDSQKQIEVSALANLFDQIEGSEERPAKIDSVDSMEGSGEKPKLINLLGRREGSCEGAFWTDSTGQIKVFSQNCNEDETDSDTVTVSNPDIDFCSFESPEMDVCTVHDEFIIEPDLTESTSVLPEGFVYVENL